MRRSTFYSCLFISVLFMFSISCKHKEKETKSVKKENSKKQKVKTPQAHYKNEGVEELDWQQKLGLSHKQVRENRLYSFIDEWYGTPYKYSGCSKSGVDCSCFANVCYEKVYGRKIARSANDIFSACDKISIEQAEEGDLVFFKIGGNKISHVGIFIKKRFFVHSSTSMGVIINSLDEAYYKKYFFCAGKMKSV